MAHRDAHVWLLTGSGELLLPPVTAHLLKAPVLTGGSFAQGTFGNIRRPLGTSQGRAGPRVRWTHQAGRDQGFCSASHRAQDHAPRPRLSRPQMSAGPEGARPRQDSADDSRCRVRAERQGCGGTLLGHSRLPLLTRVLPQACVLGVGKHSFL